MTTGLPVNRLISVAVDLAPAGAQFANVNTLLIVGDSDVIDVGERIRTYADLSSIGTDFGTTAPEYLAAEIFFAKSPKPTSVFLGRWAQAATAGLLVGAALTTAQQALANFTAITNGSLKVVIDGGAATQLTALDFHLATNLNAVASTITTALAGAATCTWDGTRFRIKSATTGASSTVSFPSSPSSGVDISGTLGLTQAAGARTVAGMLAETAEAAVVALDAMPTFWYGLMFASTHIVDSDRQAIAAYIEAAATPHIYGITTGAAAVADATSTTDIAYLLQQAKYRRTFGQYSTTSPYAVASIFGAIVTVNYEGSNTTINLMYQPEPGVTAESLTVTQANALDAKRINYCATYANGVSVLQNGTMFGDAWIDEITGADWLANYVQTNLFNLLASGKKVSQTDAGMHVLTNNIEKSMAQAVKNGFLAPGTWDSAGFGQLAQGDFLAKGYYVYIPPLSTQASADRAARKAPPIQIAAKQAGAVDKADITISLNR